MAVLPFDFLASDVTPTPWFGATMLTTLLALWFLRARNTNVDAREQKRGHTLDEIEELIEAGLHEKAAALLPSVRDEADRESWSESLARSMRWHLAWGQCRADAGAFGEARTALEQALRESSQAGDTAGARLLGIRARSELAFLGLSGTGISDEALRQAAAVLKEEQAIEDSLALGRLAWLALRLGQSEHTLGRWPAARGHFEEALRIARRVEPPARDTAQFGWALEKQLRRWANARAAGAFAALTLGQVLASVGDRDGSRTWLDRSIAALEGPEHMITHHARAMVSLERARLEPDGALSGPARRASWFEAAVREGLACGLPNGRVLAAQADLELAAQFMNLDDPVHALGHARRAAEHLKALPADAVGPIALETRLTLGTTLAETGEVDEARQTLREVLESGRSSWHPDARRHATVAAWRLFFVLVEDDQLAEAGRVLAALDDLVPGLAPAPRPFFAALAMHLHGVLGLREGKIDEARRMFESAEASARGLGGGPAADLARSAAGGRGQSAAEEEAFAEAEEHFRRALSMPPGEEPPAKEQATRADLLLNLARSIAAQDREAEAVALVRRAFREGLASGSSAGRQVAANAALLEGDLPAGEIAERRRLYETAARLGRLSRRGRGRAIAEQAEARLRELGE